MSVAESAAASGRDSGPGRGWAIVGALGVTQTVGYGVLYYSFSVLLVPMQHELGWSRAALTAAFSLALLCSGLSSVAVGRLLDLRSPRVLMTAGSALAALLVLAWSRVATLPELYLVFAGLGVAMALVLYEPAFIVVTKWFGARRTAALTAVTTIAAFASLVFSPLTEALVKAYGWRDAVAVLALVLAAVTVPLHALVLRAPSRPSRRRPEDGPAASATPRAVVGRSSFWLLVAAFAVTSFAAVAVAVHVVPLLIDSGRSPRAAAFAAGLLGLAQIPGRLVFTLTSRWLGPSANTAAVFGLLAASLGLFAASRSSWALLVFVVGYGAGNGMVTLLRATLIADLYGRTHYGAISGIVSAFALGARAAAPLGAALIALAPGGYTTLLAVLAALAGAAAVAAAKATRSASSEGTALAPVLVAPGASASELDPTL